jgi:hypothetical protein
MILVITPVAKQDIPNTHQKTTWEDVFSTRYVQDLRDTANMRNAGRGIFYAVRVEVL